MSHLPLRFLIPLIATAVAAWHCASERPPGGGPLDIEGPRVVQVSPTSGTRDMAPDQEIEITFHELVDPVSVPGSIVIMPPVDFTTRVRGRRVIIRPDGPPSGVFQPDRAYILTLQRGIRDYQRNSIPRSYQLVFSTGGEIPVGRIQGRVAEFSPQQPLEMGLFQQTDTGFVHVQSVDVSLEGTFSFDYLSDGTYRLASVEGGLSGFPAALHRRPYALPPADSLVIRSDTVETELRRSPPLADPQILAVEWRTPAYLNVTFSMPFGEAPLPADLYPTNDPAVYGYPPPEIGSDTTVIDLGQGYTQLGEPYRLEPLAVPTTAVVDTMSPTLTVVGGKVVLWPADRLPGYPDAHPAGKTAGPARYSEALGRITFSEPVRLPSGLTAILTGKDTLEVPLRRESHLSLLLSVTEPERFNRAAVLGWEITDEAGNAMTDSLLQFTLAYARTPATGSIRGKLSGITGQVVVEARDADTGKRIAYTVTDSAGYVLEQVPPGFYALIAHEQVGAYPVPYYSGRWEPYHRAARFSYYHEVVEVRPRWEVDGIDINFRPGVSKIARDVRSTNRE